MSLTIYIGRNGVGKTNQLQKINKEKTREYGKDEVIFFESEILFKDKIKDGNKDADMFKFLLEKILSNDNVMELLGKLNKEFDEISNNYDQQVAKIVEDSRKISEPNFNWNKTERILTSEGVSPEELKPFTIDSSYFDTMGTGQKMLVLLSLIELRSNKKVVIIDEPEKYCHPTLLNVVAGKIMSLVNNGIEVYIATHSPQLAKMLKWNFDNLNIVFKDENDNSIIKKIDIDKISKDPRLNKIGDKFEENGNKLWPKYYKDEDAIRTYFSIKRDEIIDILFTNKVYILEGNNDSIFLKRWLEINNKQYEEYNIFVSFGKFTIPLVLSAINQMGFDYIETYVMFDGDFNNGSKKFPWEQDVNKLINSYIVDNSFRYFEWPNNLEFNLGYKVSGMKDSLAKRDAIEFYEFLENYENANKINILWKNSKS